MNPSVNQIVGVGAPVSDPARRCVLFETSRVRRPALRFIGSCIAFILAILLLAVTSPAQTALNAVSLPLCFEAGHSQAGVTAPFAAHGPDCAFFLTATNAQFVLRKPSGETAAACMRFVAANSTPQISGEAEMPGKVNYLLGNDPAQWRSGVPVFAKVRVDDLYPGVNVVYYGNGRQLEYDFDLAAGVDPKTIAIRFDGAEKISVNAQGELVVNLNGGQIIQHRPVVYQNAGPTRREISGGYQVLDTHTAAFALGSYDRTQPLVIDPVLSYSTYFGGNSGTVIRAMALGNDGSIYVAGNTLSTLFTNVQPGYQTNFQGGPSVGDAFVARFDKSGTNRYFTYLGGNGEDTAYGLAVDSAGNAFVTGFTSSGNFPHTTNVFQPQIAGALNPVTHEYPVDAFVTELNTNGSSLIYSTFLGGNQADGGTAIAVDANDNAYVVGYTFSTNFPVTPGAYQSTLQCPYSPYINANPFLAKISPRGTNLAYASYFGGTNLDDATGIALDQSNYIYVAGLTDSTNFPSTNAVPTGKYLNGSSSYFATYDAFVAKFKPGFSNLVYSTFLGGSNYDIAYGIAVDAGGNAYVAGATASPNFPYQPPAGFSFSTNLSSFVQTNNSGLVLATNAFLTQIGWNGTNAFIGWSAVFGGYGNDVAVGVGLDAAGNVFVAGSTSSTNFPVTTNNLIGYLSATNSSQSSSSDVFITAFSTNAALLYSAYLGGIADDFGTAIAVDQSGNAYVAGQTSSTNFPTFNAPQTMLDGSYDGFLAKIVPTITLPVLTATRAGTNLLVSWQPVGQETPANSQLQSSTDLLSPNWTVVTTNFPATNFGTYIYTLPYTNPAQFFRLHLY